MSKTKIINVILAILIITAFAYGGSKVNAQGILGVIDAPTTAFYGKPITYTITLNNGGVVLTDSAVITDTLPLGAQFVPGSLEWSSGTAYFDEGLDTISWSNGFVLPGGSSPLFTSVDSSRYIPLKVSSVPAKSETSPAPSMVAETSLVIDDGSAESYVGSGDNKEFIFLNQFNTTTGTSLQQIQVYFGSETGGAQKGDDILLVVYEKSPSGSILSSTKRASFPAKVLSPGAWNVYNLGTPVTVTAGKEVLIGVIAMEKRGNGYSPAAVDTNGPLQERSWIGSWAASPNPDLLPENMDRLDDASTAGNWLIRGYGNITQPTSVTLNFDVVFTSQAETIVTNTVKIGYGSLNFSVDAVTRILTQVFLPLIVR